LIKILGLTVLLLILAPQASAQKVVRPIRVTVESEAEAKEPDNQAFHRAFKQELNKRRDIAVVSRDFDFDLFLAAGPLMERGQLIGYAGSALVLWQEKGKQKLRFLIVTAPTLEAAARHMAQRIDDEHFEAKRKGKESE
jgi:hypothetical protein